MNNHTLKLCYTYIQYMYREMGIEIMKLNFWLHRSKSNFAKLVVFDFV